MNTVNDDKPKIKRIPKRVGADLGVRLKYRDYIGQYIENLGSEIQTNGGKQCLKFADSKKDITLMLGKKISVKKQIGTESSNGLAFLTVGKSKQIKLAMKIMSSRYSDNEVEYLKLVNSLAEQGVSPNVPISYKIITCTVPCTGPVKHIMTDGDKGGIVTACPAITHKPYTLILNELADGDLKMWLHEDSHSDFELINSLQQTLLALAVLHHNGLSHCDAHYGNFLYHKVAPGGYWWYKINGQDYYVKNIGYLFVSWDFGWTGKHGYECTPNDIASPILDVKKLLYSYNAAYKRLRGQTPIILNLLHNLTSIGHEFNKEGHVSRSPIERMLTILDSLVENMYSKSYKNKIINSKPYTFNINT